MVGYRRISVDKFVANLKQKQWRERMGVEPTEDMVNAPQRV